MATISSDSSARGSEELIISHLGENSSYLYGRDPSILAYSQRPKVHQRKKLESLLSEADDDIPSSDKVKVYLRMKPFLSNEILTDDQLEAYKIINRTTLLTKLPNTDNATSGKKFKSSDIICKKYIFTQTFGPETTQLTIFEEAVRPHMIEFLKGKKNSIIMAYGTTNSGKSYTLRGKTTSPGIIPRGLEFVFSNINASNSIRFKPLNYSDVITLENSKAIQELVLKDNLLSFNANDKAKYINNYRDMQKTLQDESSLNISLDTEAQYSVWVSFAEIYNETIYDLLSNDCQNNRRTPLKLATDCKGRLFIKDLKMVNVSSGTEAYQVFMAGQYNLKIAATALNARSSRSHCIFTIKLLKYYPHYTAEQVEVSTYTFCDLAGSERLNKTLNVGDRLKEAQNINTSLLVLSRCLKCIYEYQSNHEGKKKNEIVGPFRESKLTRLFQRALSGKEHIALIVNINPAPALYDETQHVLKFSAIAKKIVQDIKPVTKFKPLRTRFSQVIAHSLKTETDWDATTGVSTDDNTEEESECMYIDEEEYLDLINENKELKKQLAEANREILERDFQTREEMATMYTEMMSKMENNYKKRLADQEASHEEYIQWREEALQEYFDEQLNLAKSKRRSLFDGDSSMSSEIKKIQTDNEELTTLVDTLKSKVRHYKELNQQISQEKDTSNFELKMVQAELKKCKQLLEAQDNEIDSQYVDALKAQLEESEERAKNFKKLLNDAKEEYLTLSENESLMQKKLAEQELQLQMYYDRISDLEDQLEVVTTCAAKKAAEIEAYETRMEELYKDMQRIEGTLSAACTENSILKQQVAQKVHEIELLHGKLESAEIKLNETLIEVRRYEIISAKEVSDFQVQINLSAEDKSLSPEKQSSKQVDALCQTKEITTDEFAMQTSFHKEEEDLEYYKIIINELNEKVNKLSSTIEQNVNKIREKEEFIEKLKEDLKLAHESTSIKDSLNEKMEQELKNTLRELNQTKECVDKCKQKELELIKSIEFNQSQTTALFTNKEELIRENERLKMKIEKLEGDISRSQHEMEAFVKNRDMALEKYEKLVDNQAKEIIEYKKMIQEVKQTPVKSNKKERDTKAQQQRSHVHLTDKDLSETSEDELVERASSRRRAKKKTTVVLTSEDEVIPQKRMTRQTRGRRELVPLTPNSNVMDDNNIVDVSSTDSKKLNKTSSLAPPRSTDIKRSRRKQLFHQDDDLVDLDQNGENIDSSMRDSRTSPHITTRSLRSRKK